MSEILDFETRKHQHALERKAAKADALKARLSAARLEAEQGNPGKQRIKATRALLDIFKLPPKPKR